MGKKKTDSIIIAAVASAILMTIGIIIGSNSLLNRQRERERERAFENSQFFIGVWLEDLWQQV